MTAKSPRVLGWPIVLAGSLFLGAQSAHAQQAPPQENPLGFYIGAGVGSSTLRQDPEEANTFDSDFERATVGWDAFVGIRPLPYLGAEAGYVDFGSAHRYQYTPTEYASTDETRFHESADAPVAFAVGYVPLQPWWDLYLKAGGARLHKSWDVVPPAFCFSGPGACSPPAASFPGSDSRWDFAYGVGTQVKYGALAWRLEYLRVNATGNDSGDPDLLTVGVSWTF